MHRTTRAALDDMARQLSERTGRTLTIQTAYGTPRLVEANGAYDRSPRLPVGQLYDVLAGMLTMADLIDGKAR